MAGISSYTDYFSLPLGEDAVRNWGAIWNGIAEKLDMEIRKCQSTITKNSSVVVKNGKVVYKKVSGQQ